MGIQTSTSTNQSRFRFVPWAAFALFYLKYLLLDRRCGLQSWARVYITYLPSYWFTEKCLAIENNRHRLILINFLNYPVNSAGSNVMMLNGYFRHCPASRGGCIFSTPSLMIYIHVQDKLSPTPGMNTTLYLSLLYSILLSYTIIYNTPLQHISQTYVPKNPSPLLLLLQASFPASSPSHLRSQPVTSSFSRCSFPTHSNGT